MKKYILPFAILSTFLLSNCGNEKETPPHVAFNWNVDSAKFDFAKYVDPMIGTAGHGHTFPGATAPFGMVQLSPDTRVDGSWDGCSGYHYDDDTIYGFSHTHLSGTGCSDYGDVLFVPGKGKILYDNGVKTNEGYRSHFSHGNEKAEAGYYSVVLDNSNTKVELTASPRVGMHRYHFANEKDNWILLDLTHRDEVIDSKMELVNDHAIQGYRFSKAWATDQRLYYYAEFSESFESAPGGRENSDSASGKVIKWAFKFNGKKQVVLKVALSAVSCENAKLNMQTEVPDFDFDAVRKKVTQQWNNELGKIEVKSGDETKKKIFYTALYHCFIAPNLYCDVNGDYRGMDNKIHTDTIHPQYTVFSLWDTYRALHPLFTIIQPKRNQDFINTFVKQYKEGGKLPVWELSANETNCMIGYHSVPVIVDAWMKGLTDFDTATAYEAMKASAMQNTNGLESYKKFGFIPAEGESESVSKTLEYAYDDWCIALAAKRMKKEDDYNYFMRRSQSWKNLYDALDDFFRPRLNNSFINPFEPSEVNFHYTEANAWQYSLAVQQDIPGLIKAHNGDRDFIMHLDNLFSASTKTSGRDQADITGLIGQYAQGNEPSHHMAYLYNYTSEPWKTQEIVSKICNQMYSDKPDGLCGNEDCGQMSAWYVLSAIGFYQVTPGSNEFQIGTPQFSDVVFHLENGKTFNIKITLPVYASTTVPTSSYPFVRSTLLNGTECKKAIVTFAEINKGGDFLFGLTDNVKEAYHYEIPGNITPPQEEVPMVPLVDIAHDTYNGRPKYEQCRTFSGSMEILFEDDYVSTPYISLNNKEFIKCPFLLTIDETTTIRAFAMSKSGVCSDTVEFSYTKIPAGRKIELNSQYANQYAAGGQGALIDGIRGTDNFRTGSWQGYEGENLEAIVDLGSSKDISKVSIGFLQDQGSWIFFPSQVIFYSSTDGKNFTEMEVFENSVDQNSKTALLHDFVTSKSAKARYIKIVAKNSGPCPSWHPGKAKPSWIFADEIVIESK